MAQILSNQRSTDGRATGQIHGPKVVDAENKNTALSSHNIFPMSYPFGVTERYGDISPFFVFDAEARDVIPLDTSFQMRSLATKSPIMQNLKKTMTWYQVDKRALLPRTYEYIYKNPAVGDDVPEGSFCNIFGYNTGYSRNRLNGLISLLSSVQLNESNYKPYLKFVIRLFFLLRDFYSDGSLLASLGCPLHNFFKMPADASQQNFDDFYDAFFSGLLEPTADFSVVFFVPELKFSAYADEGSDQFTTSYASLYKNPYYKVVSPRRMIEILSSYDFSLYVSSADLPTFIALVNNFISTLTECICDSPYHGINLERLIAYQLICAQYYTNDNIDYIYNADLWHKSMDFFVREILGSIPTFQYNDIDIMYDSCSSYIIEKLFMTLSQVQVGSSASLEKLDCFFDYFSNLMSFNRSLKFLDYFTGSKARPLAVGDVNTEVVNGVVNTLEQVHNIQLTRFLNAINRSGMRDIDYLQQIYATLPTPDYKEPKYICSRDYDFSSLEVVNTSDDQGNVTSYFHSSRDGSETRVNVEGYPAILMGVSFYEMMRLYVSAIDRDFFARDRFDFFNPYFQYDGDQEIYLDELHGPLSIASDEGGDSAPFAYTLRDMHRKLRIPRASGGFVRRLPSWAFLEQDDVSGSFNASNISPEFILSSCTEFDRFFSSLTNLSLGGYFHFEIIYMNHCSAIRPMEFAPAILNG